MTNPEWWLPRPGETPPAPQTIPENLQPNKQGYLITITDEQLADVAPFRVLSPEERRASHKAQMERATAEMARLQALLAKVHPALLPVVKHHSPAGHGFLAGSWTCKGCDAGAYAEDSPEWPCSTIELILEGVPE